MYLQRPESFKDLPIDDGPTRKAGPCPQNNPSVKGVVCAGTVQGNFSSNAFWLKGFSGAVSGSQQLNIGAGFFVTLMPGFAFWFRRAISFLGSGKSWPNAQERFAIKNLTYYYLSAYLNVMPLTRL